VAEAPADVHATAAEAADVRAPATAEVRAAAATKVAATTATMTATTAAAAPGQCGRCNRRSAEQNRGSRGRRKFTKHRYLLARARCASVHVLHQCRCNGANAVGFRSLAATCKGLRAFRAASTKKRTDRRSIDPLSDAATQGNDA
jgi:hypothetical protein